MLFATKSIESICTLLCILVINIRDIHLLPTFRTIRRMMNIFKTDSFNGYFTITNFRYVLGPVVAVYTISSCIICHVLLQSKPNVRFYFRYFLLALGTKHTYSLILPFAFHIGIHDNLVMLPYSHHFTSSCSLLRSLITLSTIGSYAIISYLIY